MDLWTIGLDDRSAEDLFTTIQAHRIETVIDVRMSKPEGYPGLTEAEDLAWLLPRLTDATFARETSLAPTAETLERHRERGATWEVYREEIFDLLDRREVAAKLDRGRFDRRTALLCSASDATNCHRSLVVEYLDHNWGGVQVHHL